MDILDLEYLTAAAVAGNFGRAAEALGVNVSTVSRRIGRVEDELGVALFERVHSGVRLTAGGHAVIPHVRRALAEVEAAKHSGMRVGSGLVGEVRLGLQQPPVGEVLVSLDCVPQRGVGSPTSSRPPASWAGLVRRPRLAA